MTKHNVLYDSKAFTLLGYILLAGWFYLEVRILIMSLGSLWHASAREGKKIAKQVRRGIYTRKDVEVALEEYGDAEPAIALQWLDKWGIKE